MEEYELAIIGGGPAGVSAAIYAARKKLNSIIITEAFGGQSVDSIRIENWVGDIAISGYELGKKLEKHLRVYENDGLNITLDKVNKVEEKNDGFVVSMNKNDSIFAKTLLLTVGSTRRKLTVKNATELEHKGLTYCASCDGPLFAGKDVAVIGGGNAGFETALQLLEYCKSVTLLHRGEKYTKADSMTVEKVLSHEKMTGILNADTTAILGDKFVNGMTYKDTKTGEEHKLDVEGIFVEIGLIPNTDIVSHLVDLDNIGRIKIDFQNKKTSHKNIWAAGDCSNVLYHQNNIASGDAVTALENIYYYIRK